MVRTKVIDNGRDGDHHKLQRKSSKVMYKLREADRKKSGRPKPTPELAVSESFHSIRLFSKVQNNSFKHSLKVAGVPGSKPVSRVKRKLAVLTGQIAARKPLLILKRAFTLDDWRKAFTD